MTDKKIKTEDRKGGKPPLAALVLRSIEASGVELFHDERKEMFARIPLEGSRRIIGTSSREFQRWLALHIFENHGICSSEPVKSVQKVLEGHALFKGLCHPLHVRNARHEGAIWVDLDGSRAVRVTTQGWQIIKDPPPLFRRLPFQESLPEPQRDGDLDLIFNFVNLDDERARLLLRCFLIAACVPDIPVPALVVHGVQGSAKTTLLKIVRKLLDPSMVPVRGNVHDATEFALAAFQNRCLFFDNLTFMPQWLSDAVCRAVTGEGFSKRTLYTDEGTSFFAYQRLLGFAGINLIARNADLLDRSLIIELQPIEDNARRPETEFWAEFSRAYPRILGGILDGLVAAMAVEQTLELPSHPRMADFARWGAAAAQGNGYTAQDFLDAYSGNVACQSDAALEASPVAQALLEFMRTQPEWRGTASELLRALGAQATVLNIATGQRTWPQTPAGLSRKLKEIQPPLRAAGIDLIWDPRSSAQRAIRIANPRHTASGALAELVI